VCLRHVNCKHISRASNAPNDRSRDSPAPESHPRSPTHHNRSHARPLRHAATATSRPSPQLRARPLDRLHALERPFSRLRLALAHRGRTFRVHGARISKRRSTVPVESGDGYASGRNRGVQCQGKGYSDRPSRGQEIWRRVSPRSPL